MKFSHRLWLFPLLLFAFAYRLYRLGGASLWYDETVSIYLARLDLVSLTRHTAGDIHPPFYYYLLHFWGQVAGWSEFSAAFLSLCFGMLLIALVYRAASELPTPPLIPPPSASSGQALKGMGNVPVISAFLVAISPYNLWYSQEVRMYTLGAFLGLASVYFFVRMLRKITEDRQQTTDQTSLFTRHSPLFSRNFVAYAIISALGLYTLYYFAFLLLFENLAALVWFTQKFRSKTPARIFGFWDLGVGIWISSQLAILLLLLPWLFTAIKQATDPPVPPWRSFVSLPNVLLESFAALALGQSVEWQSPSWVWGVLVVVAFVLIAALVPGRESQAAGHKTILGLSIWNFSLAAYTFVPLLIIYALSLWKPLYHVRYIFVYSPAFYILLALGIAKITNYHLLITRHLSRITFYVLLFVITLASIISARNFWFDPQYADDDLRGAVQRISANWRPGDAVLINAGYAYPAFLYYFDQPIAWRGRLTTPIPNLSPVSQARGGAIVLQTGSIGGDANLGWNRPESDFYATTADETRAALDRVFAAHPRVWMLRLYDTVVDPDGIVRDYFAQHARLIDDLGVAGSSYARAQGYLTSKTSLTQLPPTATRREVLLGNRIMFLGFEPKEISIHAGEAIDVNLYWRAKEATNVDARVFIGLYREEGTLAAQTDELPLGNGLGTSRWGSEEIMREPGRLIAPATRNLAPGNYFLRIQMYNPLTNEPLQAEKSEWVVEDSWIRITRVTVE